MIKISSISEYECDGTIQDIDPETNEGLEFSITPMEDTDKFSVWVGISFLHEGEMDFSKGWHHDGFSSIIEALQFLLEEYKKSC